MKKCFLLIIVILLLCACTPSTSVIQTAIAQTQTFAPTWTNIAMTPSQTATRIFTITPSQTATRSLTRTPSQTATSIYSMTPSETATPTYTMTSSETATLTFTPTSTNTSTATWTPSATIDPLTLARDDGYYLVNIDIAPGIWRNNGTDEHCFWETTSRTGTIISDYFGAGGGTTSIRPTDFAFQAKRCGTWTFLSSP